MIELEALSVRYRAQPALEEVSLRVAAGESVLIAGPSGCGKSTLARVLGGLIPAAIPAVVRGRARVAGLDPSRPPREGMATRVGLVFQNPDDQLFAEDVEEEISFALRNFGYAEKIIDERVNWALNLLDIERYKKSSPFILSGGERKRVALASVLAWDPDVLILDEPTVGQDYGQKERLKHFLLQLRTQGKTVVIVTHDEALLSEVCGRILAVRAGRLVDFPGGYDAWLDEEEVRKGRAAHEYEAYLKQRRQILRAMQEAMASSRQSQAPATEPAGRSAGSVRGSRTSVSPVAATFSETGAPTSAKGKRGQRTSG